jgi:hypothetical protein
MGVSLGFLIEVYLSMLCTLIYRDRLWYGIKLLSK